MAFSRAKIRRFNKIAEETPGVGTYNMGVESKHGQLTDFIVANRAELPKHIKDLYEQLVASEEKKNKSLQVNLDTVSREKQALASQLTAAQTEVTKQGLKIQELHQYVQRLEKNQLSLEELVSKMRTD